MMLSLKYFLHTKILIASLLFLLCNNSYSQNKIKDNIIGKTILISSKILNDERELQIFLPEEYSDENKKYPVLYILDGQRYFLHGVSLQKNFVSFKQTPNFIIVGISKKPSDRNRNYSINAQKYRDFIENEVITYVDKAFRTSEKRMLFGWAYAGGFVVETMTSDPDVFDAYIAASPFPLKEKITKVDSLIRERPNFNKLLYFTSGTNEGMVKEETNKLNTFLTNHTANQMNWTFSELEGEEHRSTPFITLYHGIKKYFSYYPELQFTSLKEFEEAGGLDHVYDYYQKRALQYGFPKQPSDWTMFSITRNAIRANNYQTFDTLYNEFEKTEFISRLRVSRACSIAQFYSKNEQYNKAIELFTNLAKQHPTSVPPLNGLGDVYTKLKKKRKASEYYQKAKELAKNNSN